MKKLNPHYLIVALTLAGALHLSATPGVESQPCSPEIPATFSTAQTPPNSNPDLFFSVTRLAPPHEEIIMEETEEVRSSNKKFLDSSHLDVRLLYALTPVNGIRPSAFGAIHPQLPPQKSLHILFGVLRV